MIDEIKTSDTSPSRTSASIVLAEHEAEAYGSTEPPSRETPRSARGDKLH